jgi:hypothetical protein
MYTGTVYYDTGLLTAGGVPGDRLERECKGQRVKLDLTISTLRRRPPSGRLSSGRQGP